MQYLARSIMVTDINSDFKIYYIGFIPDWIQNANISWNVNICIKQIP